jgi:DNA-binding beta-propeller fold protein YncE
MSFGQTPDTGTKDAATVAATQEEASLPFVSTFSTDGDVNGNRTFCQHLRDLVHPSAAGVGMAPDSPAMCDQVLNVVAGKDKAEFEMMTRPILAAKITVDSNLRVLITEPATRSVHILDFVNRKYSRIDGARGDRMSNPYSIAVDADNNIYVTDLDRGRIVVYNSSGKFLKYIGNLKGEGLFQTPRSIAIDRASGRIYLADTARDFILILNRDGSILSQLGKRGGGNNPNEFKEPTDVAIHEKEVFVLDRQNARIQVLDLDGNFRRQFRLKGTGSSDSSGMAFDSQGRIFVASVNWIEIFNREGQLLFRFGRFGAGQGQFKSPKGICTDSKDRVYVVDSGNRRIQVFQATDQLKSNTEAAR